MPLSTIDHGQSLDNGAAPDSEPPESFPQCSSHLPINDGPRTSISTENSRQNIVVSTIQQLLIKENETEHLIRRKVSRSRGSGNI